MEIVSTIFIIRLSLVVDKVSTRNEFKESQNYTKLLRKLSLAFEVSKIS